MYRINILAVLLTVGSPFPSCKPAVDEATVKTDFDKALWLNKVALRQLKVLEPFVAAPEQTIKIASTLPNETFIEKYTKLDEKPCFGSSKWEEIPYTVDDFLFAPIQTAKSLVSFVKSAYKYKRDTSVASDFRDLLKLSDSDADQRTRDEYASKASSYMFFTKLLGNADNVAPENDSLIKPLAYLYPLTDIFFDRQDAPSRKILAAAAIDKRISGAKFNPYEKEILEGAVDLTAAFKQFDEIESTSGEKIKFVRPIFLDIHREQIRSILQDPNLSSEMAFKLNRGSAWPDFMTAMVKDPLATRKLIDDITFKKGGLSVQLSMYAGRKIVSPQLKKFSLELGYLVQLFDDIGDIVEDLMEGKITLPILYLLSHEANDKAGSLRQAIREVNKIVAMAPKERHLANLNITRFGIEQFRLLIHQVFSGTYHAFTTALSNHALSNADEAKRVMKLISLMISDEVKKTIETLDLFHAHYLKNPDLKANEILGEYAHEKKVLIDYLSEYSAYQKTCTP